MRFSRSEGVGAQPADVGHVEVVAQVGAGLQAGALHVLAGLEQEHVERQPLGQRLLDPAGEQAAHQRGGLVAGGRALPPWPISSGRRPVTTSVSSSVSPYSGCSGELQGEAELVGRPLDVHHHAWCRPARPRRWRPPTAWAGRADRRTPATSRRRRRSACPAPPRTPGAPSPCRTARGSSAYIMHEARLEAELQVHVGAAHPQVAVGVDGDPHPAARSALRRAGHGAVARLAQLARPRGRRWAGRSPGSRRRPGASATARPCASRPPARSGPRGCSPSMPIRSGATVPLAVASQRQRAQGLALGVKAELVQLGPRLDGEPLAVALPHGADPTGRARPEPLLASRCSSTISRESPRSDRSMSRYSPEPGQHQAARPSSAAARPGGAPPRSPRSAPRPPAGPPPPARCRAAPRRCPGPATATPAGRSRGWPAPAGRAAAPGSDRSARALHRQLEPATVGRLDAGVERGLGVPVLEAGPARCPAALLAQLGLVGPRLHLHLGSASVPRAVTRAWTWARKIGRSPPRGPDTSTVGSPTRCTRIGPTRASTCSGVRGSAAEPVRVRSASVAPTWASSSASGCRRLLHAQAGVDPVRGRLLALQVELQPGQRDRPGRRTSAARQLQLGAGQPAARAHVGARPPAQASARWQRSRRQARRDRAPLRPRARRAHLPRCRRSTCSRCPGSARRSSPATCSAPSPSVDARAARPAPRSPAGRPASSCARSTTAVAAAPARLSARLQRQSRVGLAVLASSGEPARPGAPAPPPPPARSAGRPPAARPPAAGPTPAAAAPCPGSAERQVQAVDGDVRHPQHRQLRPRVQLGLLARFRAPTP